MSIDITIIHSWDDEMTCACRGGGNNKCIHCLRAGVSWFCLGCWLLIAFEDQPWSTLKTTVFSPLRVAEKVWEGMLNDTIEQKSHREIMNWALKEQLLPESWREGTPGPGLEDAVSMLPFWTISNYFTGYCGQLLMSGSWRIAIRLYFPFFSSGTPSVSATDYPSSSSSSLSWTVRTLSF